MSEGKSWSNTSPCAADIRQVMVGVFIPRGRRRLPVIGEIDVMLAHQLPGKLAEGHAPLCTFDKNNH